MSKRIPNDSEIFVNFYNCITKHYKEMTKKIEVGCIDFDYRSLCNSDKIHLIKMINELYVRNELKNVEFKCMFGNISDNQMLIVSKEDDFSGEESGEEGGDELSENEDIRFVENTRSESKRSQSGGYKSSRNKRNKSSLIFDDVKLSFHNGKLVLFSQNGELIIDEFIKLCTSGLSSNSINSGNSYRIFSSRIFSSIESTSPKITSSIKPRLMGE